MLDWVQNTIDGVMIGAGYALLALGFTLVFGVMRRLNLAYGATLMLGAYGGTILHVEFGAGALLVALASIIGAALVGIYVERLCFAPMGPKAGVAAMVSSFAIWMQLEQIAVLALPRHTYPFPAFWGGEAVLLGPFSIRPDHLVMLATALALVAGLVVLLKFTRFGLAMRAVIDSERGAHLSGVPVGRVMLLSFALASAIGGVAGVLILAADQQITPMFGMWAMFKGLIAMMLGGVGSLPGAVVGGLVLGIAEAHAGWYLGAQARDLLAYTLLFAVLVIRPGGLLGRAPWRDPAFEGR